MKSMYIRKTKTGTAASGETYYTYRLVSSQRVGDKVRQRTLLNLGRNFSLPREQWPELCAAIDRILSGQMSLIDTDEEISNLAQTYAAQLVVTQGSSPTREEKQEADFQEVDVDSLQLLRPRSVGVEHVALEALQQLDLPDILTQAGFNGRQRAAAIGSIIGRMAAAGSELSTWCWLQGQSALGDLLEFKYESMSLMQLYRASDRLIRRQPEIEEALFSRIQDLFSLSATVTLYDLTNTFFEGKAEGNTKARYGHSKEKRRDCPLVTLGLVLDGSGFARRSKVFAGNVAEGTTLETMLEELDAPSGALVIMDRGVATEENVKWLKKHGYRYLVVSREQTRSFDPQKAVSIQSATGIGIHIQREVNEEGTEARLYCYSEQRAEKEEAINARFCKRFEEGLAKIAASLTKPRGTKKHDKVVERISRLKEKSRGIGQHYRIDLVCDEKKGTVTHLSWHRETKPGSRLSHPGVYCLRTNELEWDDETLWRTYTMLTDLEAVFRSLKSELGLRPIYHRKEERSDGHLFITVLAYQAVQVIRRKLKECGVYESWSSLRKTFSVQQRVTVTFQQKDGRTLHVRKATVAEPALKKLYEFLGLDASPGGIKKLSHNQ